MTIYNYLAAALLPWFGLSVSGAHERCIEVILVQPGAAAYVAGLRDHDCVAAVNDQPATDGDTLAALLRGTNVDNERQVGEQDAGRHKR